MLRPRYRSRSEGGSSSGGMDLGTRALILGIASLLVSWVPILNVLAFLAALMAVAFGLMARRPGGLIATDVEPDPRRALWAIVLGAVAVVVFVITAIRYSVL